MIPQTLPQRQLSSSQISVAAEALATAQFALAGFDILEQAGRARFHFDLAVARSGGMMRLRVHPSFNGLWDLVDRYLDASKRASLTTMDYHDAINLWLKNHSSRVTCCLVEFEPAVMNRMPQLYLASPGEVAVHLHEMINQLANEELSWFIGMDVVHRLESLPKSWRFSQARIAELMELPLEETTFVPHIAAAPECKDCARTKPAACVKCLPMMN